MEIRIDGCVEVQDGVTCEEFTDKFIEFLEFNGWYFGGGIEEYDECLENLRENGKRLKEMFDIKQKDINNVIAQSRKFWG